MNSVSRAQPPKILKKLSLTLHAILNRYLTNADDAGETAAKVRIALALALKQGSFPHELLYREQANSDMRCLVFRQAHITYHAWAYVEYLFSRPIQVVNKHGAQITNMHKVFIDYLQRHRLPFWHAAQMARRAAPELSEQDQRPDAEFSPLADRLNQLLADKRPNYSAISKQKQQQHGAYWLTVADRANEFPEELTIDELLELLPQPLVAQAYPPSSLTDTLSTLNARYAYFRSLGIDPTGEAAQHDFTSDQLKTLKKLHQRIQQLCREGHSHYAASYQAFDEFKASDDLKQRALVQRAFEGRFESFYWLYHPQTQALPDVLSESEVDDALWLNSAEEQEIAAYDAIDKAWLQAFQQQHPQLYDPVLAQAWSALLIDERTPNDLLDDPVFMRLTAQHTEYSGLDRQALLDRLELAFEQLLGLMMENHDARND